MNEPTKYDRIGVGYSKHRAADPRFVDAIVELLNLTPGSTLAEIGAGSGNYSRALAERGFHVRAIEPSQVMRAQAEPHARVEWLEGRAENVPLPDHSVDGVVVILALHHFAAPDRAAREMLRICDGPIVIFTHDPRAGEQFWLSDYFPEVFAEADQLFPPMASVASLFPGRTTTLRECPLPHDVCDLFLAAGWRRPEVYLDPDVRAGISGFALADQDLVTARIERLRKDLDSTDWHRRYGAILEVPQLDAGYRMLCVRPR